MPTNLLYILIGVLILVDVFLFWRYRQYVRFLINTRMSTMAAEITQDWTLLATGESGDLLLERALLKAMKQSYDMFVKKNHDYGTSNLSSAGIKGIAVRLGDKISRLWQLVGLRSSKEQKVKSESIADTLMDAANYCLVGYLMVNGDWPAGTVVDNIGPKAIADVLINVYGDLDTSTQAEILTAIYANRIVHDIGGVYITK